MKFKGTVAELLEQLKINKGTVLVTRDNELLTSDEKVEDADEIRILSVISGG
ncbi:MoaD/ThiS family protein [Candidatus Woesearchaeota archaeon]|nr:MoaD/ThiS family protein [Candidatus Woesearchaeota archaeon]